MNENSENREAHGRSAAAGYVAVCRECGGTGRVHSANPDLQYDEPHFPCPSCSTKRAPR